MSLPDSVRKQFQRWGSQGGRMAARRLIKARRRRLLIAAAKDGLGPVQNKSARKIRSDKMAEMYCSGMTLEAIGAQFGVTRERIRQILVLAGVGPERGGSKSKTAAKEEERQRLRAELLEQSARSVYGCSRDTVIKINGGGALKAPGAPCFIYRDKQRDAIQREIEWLFTLETWWNAWQQSGKWNERGRGGDQYCMARIGDKGPYSPDNVQFITIRQNAVDGQKNRPYGKRLIQRDDRLNPRQREAYDHYRAGLPVKEIAKRMKVASNIVAIHLNHAKHKLGIL